ncbi:MAG: hypothetical protein KAX53_05625 [Saprospiraceae bacterium]|jgi:hypothetical protein|nr:hypothetical protein [Saprospiraceae bacterium]MBK6666865.1 hypothetical protein [Saprospiraceae bacterium]MBK7697470.1 hypothetical protein [Saprospiraceae bacterium]MBK8826051.1 hypothetical protein [Saprospiraceae bacterium]MBK8885893.1 hypothetical protein [Saprospiraceae bacterium]
MQKNIKEIIPGSGLGAIKFGMTRDEVIKIAGKPDDVENLPGFEEEISDTLESWHYDEYEFSLVFDADYEWRLVSIAVSDPYFTYNGVSIVGMDKQDVMDMLEKNNIEISGMEDVSDEENPNLELVESDEEGLMIWFENDEAIEIQILPDVEEDGETLIWPA